MTFLKTIVLLIHLFFTLYNSYYKNEGSKSGLPSGKETIEFVEDVNPLDRVISEHPIYIQPPAATRNE